MRDVECVELMQFAGSLRASPHCGECAQEAGAPPTPGRGERERGRDRGLKGASLPRSRLRVAGRGQCGAAVPLARFRPPVPAGIARPRRDPNPDPPLAATSTAVRAGPGRPLEDDRGSGTRRAMELSPLHARILHSRGRQVCGAGEEAEDERSLHKARAELEDVRRQWLGVQRETLAVRALQKGLEQSLQTSVQRHALQCRSLAKMVGQLEHELKEVRGDIEHQVWQNQLLVNTKVRLEGEIGRYRSLLDKEEGRLSSAAAVGSASPLGSFRQKQVSLPSVPPVEGCHEQRVEMVATQEIHGHNSVAKSSKARGKIQTERVDEVIKEWECSFFKDNPHLRKKSASLRFDLHLAATYTEEGGCRGQQAGLPDIELRLVMRKSSSIPSLKS